MRIAGWLVVTSRQEILALQMPEIATESHDAADISVRTMETTPKTRQSMPDSVALSSVSGTSPTKETVRTHPAWTEYSIIHVRSMTLLINQPIIPTESVGFLNRPAS